MTKAEMLLAAQLLEMAGQSFGNHSCNDFERPEYLSRADWDAINEADAARNGESEDFEPGRQYAQDFCLMYHLAARLLEEGEAMP